MQQITGLVVVALHDVAIVIDILTNAGTVDADIAREADIDIGIGESGLVGSLGLVECQEGIVLGRTEGYQQHGNILL